MKSTNGKRADWSIWVDTGGTFTDCLGMGPDGLLKRAKVLSNGTLRAVATKVEGARISFDASWIAPDSFAVGARVRRLGDKQAGVPVAAFKRGLIVLDMNHPFVEGDALEFILDEEAPILAARLITGTPFNRPLPSIALHLATTRGTNALLERRGAKTAFFVTGGFKDLLVIGDQRRPDLFALNIVKPRPFHDVVVEVDERVGPDGETVRSLDLESLKPELKRLLDDGVETAAIAFLHSHRFPDHELRLRDLLLEVGFSFVSVSSELAPFIKVLPRAQTAVVNAYLSPVMHRYLDRVAAVLSAESSVLRIMTSAGGLIACDSYHPKDGLLSGPAGGVVGAATVARAAGYERILAFDMGGTSTDVSRFDGAYDYRFEQNVGDARLTATGLRIETVAAGGGSVCGYGDQGLFVGPESAGAFPGPACYGAGGPLTLTDVNLLLDRLDASRFGIPVNRKAAEERLAEIIESISKAEGRDVDSNELLLGFLDVANERMADTVRRISVRAGYDPREYALLAFGGAGGLHACAIADKLEMDAILFPADAGLLSALGLRHAVIERMAERQVLRPLAEIAGEITSLVESLTEEARSRLESEGVGRERMEVRRRIVQMRFVGQESSHEIEYDESESLEAGFRRRYENVFGYYPSGKAIEIVAIRIVVAERVSVVESETFPEDGSVVSDSLFQRAIDRSEVSPGTIVEGPALVQDSFSTIFIEDGWRAVTGSFGTLRIERCSAGGQLGSSSERDVLIELELFSNRFTAIVEEMGSMLERTAVSTNVKERLDFSCALLDVEGELITNAPHIPVHLGALGLCVRTVLTHIDVGPGDMIVTNHPAFGGSHLPDVTVISGVFDEAGGRVGFVANRAHHAEMGGIRPGSMPTSAQSLAEEGVVVSPMYLYRAGTERFADVASVLAGGPHPTRALDDNLADLSAQAAANRRGVEMLEGLVRAHGSEKIRGFMQAMKRRATEALAKRIGTMRLDRITATERLDDGAELCVAATRDGDRLILDFEGTAGVHPGNFNATPAIVRSAVIYFLRLLVQESVPLNEGLLADVDIRLPEGMLNPPFPDDPGKAPAVVGGNVETSQRLVDLLIRLFDVAACSQGTMNNFIFGNESVSYYETICGGSGAVDGHAGCDAVHTHMTNTGITDPEIFETRFPVRIERFEIRRGSGGGGAFRGGDGVVREVRFTESVTVSMLTQHRIEEPFGSAGGMHGARGRQRVIRVDGSVVQLGPQVEIDLQPGDRLVIETPGGGGLGKARESEASG